MEVIVVMLIVLVIVQQYRIRKMRIEMADTDDLAGYLSEWLYTTQRFAKRLIFDNSRLRRELQIAAEEVAEDELEYEDKLEHEEWDWRNTDERPYGEAG